MGIGTGVAVKEKILVVDDDESVRQAICDYLAMHGYCVRPASGGQELDKALGEAAFDLVILDLMMPGEDGLQICRRLRNTGPPVLMLSALGETTDRVVGLELGADDYLAKPFEPRELLARVRAVLRRGLVRTPGGEPVFHFEGWRLDPAERSLRAPDDSEVQLTAGEFLLLRTFVERPRRILTRDMLIELTRGHDSEPFDRAVDLAISRLRRKLEPAGDDLIETVRGEGYRFRPQVRRG